MTCLLRTPTVKLASPFHVCCSGCDRWRGDFSVQCSCLCKHLSLNLYILLQTNPIIFFPLLRRLATKDYVHMDSIWANASTTAYIIQWLSHQKNKLLCNSVGPVAWRGRSSWCIVDKRHAVRTNSDLVSVRLCVLIEGFALVPCTNMVTVV